MSSFKESTEHSPWPLWVCSVNTGSVDSPVATVRLTVSPLPSPLSPSAGLTLLFSLYRLGLEVSGFCCFMSPKLALSPQLSYICLSGSHFDLGLRQSLSPVVSVSVPLSPSLSGPPSLSVSAPGRNWSLAAVAAAPPHPVSGAQLRQSSR